MWEQGAVGIVCEPNISDLEAVAGFWEGSVSHVAPDDTAVLQYTSGTTSLPRGAEITHRAVLHATRGILAREVSSMVPEPVVVSWMPHYHDMQLVGVLLSSLTQRCHAVIMDPFDFTSDPLLWWRTADRFKATHVVGPDFAYSISSKCNADEVAKLNLSHLRCAVVGAEVLRMRTLQAFTEKFAAARFSPEAWTPAYGLAESCVVALRPGSPEVLALDALAMQEGIVKAASPSSLSQLLCVSHGVPVGLDVIIVDPHTQEPLEGRIGEIWVHSASNAKGYFRLSKATMDTFRCTLKMGPQSPYLIYKDVR